VKLLLDQNLSRRLVAGIEGSFPGSVHVTDVGLDTASDRSIWEWAGERGYVVVSKDTDFRQLAFLYGPPPKVVWLSVGNVSTAVIEALLLGCVARISRFVDDEEEALLVVSRSD
jgi:predicted nuclease of predicted toxin-antitoxin system